MDVSSIICRALSGEEIIMISGLIVLIIIVATVVAIIALGDVSKKADNQSESLYKKLHRGDSNENNQS